MISKVVGDNMIEDDMIEGGMLILVIIQYEIRRLCLNIQKSLLFGSFSSFLFSLSSVSLVIPFLSLSLEGRCFLESVQLVFTH